MYFTVKRNMNKRLFAFYTILFTSLFSIGVMTYSTYMIAQYYLYNVDNNIFIAWILFYSGFSSFCLSLYFMKRAEFYCIEFDCIYAILIFFVGISIAGTYIIMFFKTGQQFGFAPGYYYLLPFTAVVGFSLVIVFVYTYIK